MKNKTKTFSIAAFVAFALALTVPFSVSAEVFAPAVATDIPSTTQGLQPFVPVVSTDIPGTTEGVTPFVPVIATDTPATTEGFAPFIPVVATDTPATTEGFAPFIPVVATDIPATTEGTPLVFPPATTTSTSTEVVTETPAVTPVAAVSRSSRSGGRSGGVVSPLAILAAADVSSTTCPYINSFITVNGTNDAVEVARLQAFLNTSEGAALAVTGIYNAATQDAVAIFQLKHSADILAPWNQTEASKNVYFTTKKKINELVCGGSFALTPAELAEIAQTRDAVVSGAPVGTGTTGATGVIGSVNSTSTTLTAATSTGSTTNSNVAAAFVGGNFLSKFFSFVKGIFTGSN
jgi:hypothetical protein